MGKQAKARRRIRMFLPPSGTRLGVREQRAALWGKPLILLTAVWVYSVRRGFCITDFLPFIRPNENA